MTNEELIASINDTADTAIAGFGGSKAQKLEARAAEKELKISGMTADDADSGEGWRLLGGDSPEVFHDIQATGDENNPRSKVYKQVAADNGISIQEAVDLVDSEALAYKSDLDYRNSKDFQVDQLSAPNDPYFQAKNLAEYVVGQSADGSPITSYDVYNAGNAATDAARLDAESNPDSSLYVSEKFLTGEKGYFGRELSDNKEYVNRQIAAGYMIPGANDPEEYKAQLELYENAKEQGLGNFADPRTAHTMDTIFNTSYGNSTNPDLDPYVDMSGNNGYIENAAKSGIAAITGGFYGIADTVSELAGAGVNGVFGEGTVDWDLGTEDERRKEVNRLVGYDDTRSAASMKIIGKEAKAMWDAGELDADGLWTIAKTAFTDADTFMYSLGTLAIWMIGGTVGSAAKLAKTVKLAKAARAAGDTAKAAKYIKDAKALRIKANSISAGTKAAGVFGNILAKDAGFNASVMSATNDDIDKFKKNNGGEYAIDDIARIALVNYASMGLDKFTDLHLLRSTPGAIDGLRQVAKAMGGKGREVIRKKIGVMSAAVFSGAGALVASMGKEGAQEYVQTMAEIFNEQYGTEKYGDDASDILLNDKNIVEGLTAAGAGAGGGAQFHTIGTAKGIVVGASNHMGDQFNPKRTEALNSKAAQAHRDASLDDLIKVKDPAAQKFNADLVNEDLVATINDLDKIPEDSTFEEHVANTVSRATERTAAIYDIKSDSAKGVVAAGLVNRIIKSAKNVTPEKKAKIIKAATAGLSDKAKETVYNKIINTELSSINRQFRDSDSKVEAEAITAGDGETEFHKLNSEKLEAIKAKAESLKSMGSTFDDDGYISRVADTIIKQVDSYTAEGKTANDVNKEIFETGFSIQGQFGSTYNKSMIAHSADIQEDMIKGDSEDSTAIKSLQNFVNSRGASKISDTNSKGKTFNNAQQASLARSVYENNNRIGDTIDSLIDIAKANGRDGYVARLDGMKAELNQHNVDLLAKAESLGYPIKNNKSGSSQEQWVSSVADNLVAVDDNTLRERLKSIDAADVSEYSKQQKQRIKTARQYIISKIGSTPDNSNDLVIDGTVGVGNDGDVITDGDDIVSNQFNNPTAVDKWIDNLENGINSTNDVDKLSKYALDALEGSKNNSFSKAQIARVAELGMKAYSKVTVDKELDENSQVDVNDDFSSDEDVDTVASDLSEVVNHEDGDSLFDVVDKNLGMVNSGHYYFGKRTSKGNVALTEDQVTEGTEWYKKSLYRTGRREVKDNSKRNLLSSNWHQIKNSSQVIAVAELTKDKTGVQGDIDYAVAMAQEWNSKNNKNQKEINVFDPAANKWYQWNGNKFQESSLPKLHKNFAGIGSKSVEDSVKTSFTNNRGKAVTYDEHSNTLTSKIGENTIKAISELYNNVGFANVDKDINNFSGDKSIKDSKIDDSTPAKLIGVVNQAVLDVKDSPEITDMQFKYNELVTAIGGMNVTNEKDFVEYRGLVAEKKELAAKIVDARADLRIKALKAETDKIQKHNADVLSSDNNLTMSPEFLKTLKRSVVAAKVAAVSTKADDVAAMKVEDDNVALELRLIREKMKKKPRVDVVERLTAQIKKNASKTGDRINRRKARNKTVDAHIKNAEEIGTNVEITADERDELRAVADAENIVRDTIEDVEALIDETYKGQTKNRNEIKAAFREKIKKIKEDIYDAKKARREAIILARKSKDRGAVSAVLSSPKVLVTVLINSMKELHAEVKMLKSKLGAKYEVMRENLDALDLATATRIANLRKKLDALYVEKAEANAARKAVVSSILRKHTGFADIEKGMKSNRLFAETIQTSGGTDTNIFNREISTRSILGSINNVLNMGLLPTSMQRKIMAELDGVKVVGNSMLEKVLGDIKFADNWIAKGSGVMIAQDMIIKFGENPKLSKEDLALVRSAKLETVSDDNGVKRIVLMKDGNEIVLPDGSEYAINPMMMITDYKDGDSKSGKAFSKKLREVVAMEGMQLVSDMLSVKHKSGAEMEQFIKGIFGVDQNSNSYQSLVGVLMSGNMPEAAFVQSAGKNVMKLLGIKANKDLNVDQANALVSALGQMVIEQVKGTAVNGFDANQNYLMKVDSSNGSISIRSSSDAVVGNLPVDDQYTSRDGKEFRLLSFNVTDDVKKQLLSASSTMEYLGVNGHRKGVMLEPGGNYVTGEKLIRGTNTLADEKDVEYLNTQEQIPRTFNETFKVLEKVLGNKSEDWYEALLQPYEDIAKLPAREREVAIVNRKAGEFEIDGILETRAFAEDDEFYLEWDMTSSDRYMVDSNVINPQNGKISRFLVGMQGMRSTMKWGKDGFAQEDIDLFHAAASQALGYGIDKNPDANVITELNNEHFKLGRDGELVFADTEHGNELKGWVQAVKDGKVPDMRSEDPKERMHALQLVVALSKVESGKDLEHELVIEMDGVTNGMIMTLLQIGTDEAMALLEKGGVYYHSQFQGDSNNNSGSISDEELDDMINKLPPGLKKKFTVVMKKLDECKG